MNNELSRLFNAFATRSTLEPVALKAATVLPLLVLQKKHRTSKSKDHISCLEKSLAKWKKGDMLREGRAIQDRLPKTHSRQNGQQQLPRSFARLMFQGKTNAALQLLSNNCKGSVLHLNDTVRDSTVRKHPDGTPALPESTIDGVPPDFHPDSIDTALIRSTSLKTTGAAGPTGLEADNCVHHTSLHLHPYVNLLPLQPDIFVLNLWTLPVSLPCLPVGSLDWTKTLE